MLQRYCLHADLHYFLREMSKRGGCRQENCIKYLFFHLKLFEGRVLILLKIDVFQI